MKWGKLQKYTTVLSGVCADEFLEISNALKRLGACFERKVAKDECCGGVLLFF